MSANTIPLGADKIRIKFPETQKIGLSIEEMKALESVDNLTPQEEHARIRWLFSFLLAGMRVADVLLIRWSDIYDGRLHYQMNKNENSLSSNSLQRFTPYWMLIVKPKNTQMILSFRR